MPREPQSSQQEPQPTPPVSHDRDRREDGRPENARPRDQFGAPLPRDAVDEMPDRVEPEEVCDTVEEAITRAVALCEDERFFEAHEFFEWAWKGPVTPEAERSLFKGLAQVAVGCTHTQRGNVSGARTLLERGIAHVAPYAQNDRGLDVAALADGVDVLLEWLERNPPTPAAPFPTFPFRPSAGQHDHV